MSCGAVHRRAFKRQRNVVGRILSMPLTGIGPKSVTQVPVESLKNVIGDNACAARVIVHTLARVEAASVQMPVLPGNTEHVEKAMTYLLDIRMSDGGSVKRTPFDLHIFTSILPSLVTGVMASKLSPFQNSPWDLARKNLCIQVLHTVLVKNKDAGSQLCLNDELVHQCLCLQVHPATACYASWLFSNFLANRRDLLRLVSISHLRLMLQSLSPSGLAQMCPFLAASLEKGKVRDASILKENAHFLSSITGLERKLWEYIKNPSVTTAGAFGNAELAVVNMQQRTWPVWVLLKVKFVRLALLRNVARRDNEAAHVADILGAMQDIERTLEEAETTAGMVRAAAHS